MDRALFWALFFVVALAPLPLGANRPLGWSVLSLCVGTLLVLWSVRHWWLGRELPTRFEWIGVPAVLFMLATGWVCIQLIPGMPFGFAHPAWNELNVFFDTEVPGRITLDPDWTKTQLMRWLAYAGVFWLAVQMCRDRQLAHQALVGFALISAAYALYGIVTLHVFENRILGYENWANSQSLSSTFVNRNSYATFAGLGILTCLALLMAHWSTADRRDASPRERILDFLSSALSTNAYLFLALFALGTALFLTASRGGVGSALVALLVLLLINFNGKSAGVGTRVAMRLASILVVLVGVAALSGSLLFDRFEQNNNHRILLYERTIAAIEDYAYIGSGLGSFPQVFPLYRYEEPLNPKFVSKAHNSYLESLLELGIPAALCLFFSLGSLALICWRGLNTGARDRHYAALGVAVSSLVGLHALVDFSLQIPAVAMSFSYLMGLAVAQSFSSRR